MTATRGGALALLATLLGVWMVGAEDRTLRTTGALLVGSGVLVLVGQRPR